jgi:hypothetical protein
MLNLLNLPVAVRYALGGALALALLVLLFNPAGVVLLLLIFLAVVGVRRQARAREMLAKFLVFVQKHAIALLALQCVVYALAYNSLLPAGMYFSPDSVVYLSVNNVVPPTFSLFARGLVELELVFGSTRMVLLRYLMIVMYTAGGCLLARALLKSGRPVLALLVLPALWSMSSLTQWFNYFLTDGLATTLMVACIGAYANLYVSIRAGDLPSRRAWGWLALFVLLGMLAFSTRPAFVFVAPVMVLLMFNRAIFQWRRVFAASLGIALLATAHFSFAYYWHGRAPSQMGGVLTALVFDFPVPHTCEPQDDSNLCRTQRALEPFIKASRELGPTREQYVYKVLNNGPVVQSARAAVKDGDPNYTALLEIAILKIRTNPGDYGWMVLKNSYYSVKSWGDWAWNDNLGQGSVAMVNIENTNAVAPSVSAVMQAAFGVHFDPTIAAPSKEHFYKNILFQFPSLVLSHKVVSRMTPVLLVLVISFALVPVWVPVSLPLSILFACCAMVISGTIFQNAFVPVIPRLLYPFHPLAVMGVLMLLSLIVDQSRKLLKPTNSTVVAMSNPMSRSEGFLR